MNQDERNQQNTSDNNQAFKPRTPTPQINDQRNRQNTSGNNPLFNSDAATRQTIDGRNRQNTFDDNQASDPHAATPQTIAERNNRNATGNSSSSSSRIFIILAVILVAYFCTWSGVTPEACDMKIAANRDFNKYYGIDGLRNHFTTPTADECDSSIIFRPALPQAILKADNSASSFLTLAKYGTGKTLLRCEYFKSLKADNYLKVLVLNKQISEYIERFVTRNSRNEKNCENTNCLHGWTENEFAQLILSTLVTEFINKFQHQKLMLKDTSIEEKIELITIICYYYNGFGTSELENFVNNFLNKSAHSKYQADTAVVQIQERNVAQDKPLLIHLKKDLEKFSVLKQDYEQLHLLLAVIEGEGFQHKAIVKNMYGRVFHDLTHLSLFIKKYINQIPVFIIDGIDENQYFFQKNAVNKASIESFCRSSISQEILSKVMANDFYLSIFYPKIEGIDIQDAIIRKDKFPTHGITWTSKSLINYADYILQEMNHNASEKRCEPFTDFKTLVNYSHKKNSEIINKIPTPRALHYFMIELITEMNNDANDVTPPYKATFENVHNAYEKSYDYFNKIHRVQ